MRSLATIIVVAILGFASLAAAQESAPASIAGVYEAIGQNPDGSSYKSTVEIVQSGSSFLILWIQKDESGTTVGETLGVGILTDNVLSVSYFGGRPAVVSYRVKGGELSGQWI